MQFTKKRALRRDIIAPMSSTEPIETLFSTSARFRAEVSKHSKPGTYKAHYFGPGDLDLGEREHVGNWLGVKDSVGRQLEDLEGGFTFAGPGTQI